MARLEKLKNGVRYVANERLDDERRRCSSFATRLGQHSARRLATAQAWTGYALQRLAAAAEGAAGRQRTRLELLEVSVTAASPRRILSRGYAIVRGVRSAGQVEVGQPVEIELRDGVLGANIISKSTHKKNG